MRKLSSQNRPKRIAAKVAEKKTKAVAARAKAQELNLESFLPYRLSVLSNRISQAIARIYAEQFDLSVTEWRVMAVLGRFPDLSANEVAERTAMDKVQVSRAVASLQQANRVERDMDGDDKRRSVLRLSTAGRKIHQQVAPLVLNYEAQLLDVLEPSERETLDSILQKLMTRDVSIKT